MGRGLFFLLSLPVVIAMIMSTACAPSTVEKDNPPLVPAIEQKEEQVSSSGQTSHVPSLGNLCSGTQECISFCQKNRGHCERYCIGNHENTLCRTIFPPQEYESATDKNAQKINQDIKTCIGNGTILFTSPPMALENIAYIEPIGQMIGGHVTPIDHGYYTAKNWKPGTARDNPNVFREIMAPADGIIQSVESMPQEFQSSPLGDYRIVMYHTCSLYTIYIHVNQLSSKLQSIAGTGKTVEIKAGEVIGKAPGFDFSVHNDEITLSGFLIPEHYLAEPWKIHTADMFAYFAEPLRSKLLEKNVRQKEPRGGKIDYDIDGKLVGNWFEENSHGYYGKEQYQRMSGYWVTHLSFAYDGLDPSLIIISLGNFSNEARQFAIRGNSPDPAIVDTTYGLVRYELVNFEYLTDEQNFWDKVSFAKITKAKGMDQIMGTVLVQMIEKRKINVEVFPEKKASEVKDFTQNAKVYER